jgi:hypothetical protein
VASSASFGFTPQIERVHNRALFEGGAQKELRDLLIKHSFQSSVTEDVQALPFSFRGENASVYLNQYGGCTIYCSDGTKIALSDPSKSGDGKVHVYKDNQLLSDEEGSKVLTTFSPWFAAALEAVQKHDQENPYPAPPLT